MAVEQMRGWWPGWEQFLLAFCAAFHLVVFSWLAFAPDDQVHTAGTEPALHWVNRYEWAVVFLLLGVTVAAQVRIAYRSYLRVLVWAAVFFVGGLWLTAFGMAVVRGEGSGAFIGWGFLYTLWAVVALRMSLRKR